MVLSVFMLEIACFLDMLKFLPINDSVCKDVVLLLPILYESSIKMGRTMLSSEECGLSLAH